MNNLQAIKKCQKKAWKEIQQIQNASNFLEVEQSISDAVEKTFGMWDKGLLLVRMKRLGEMGELEGQLIIRIRRANFDKWQWLVRNYLEEFIPKRFFHTLMYKRYIGEI